MLGSAKRCCRYVELDADVISHSPYEPTFPERSQERRQQYRKLVGYTLDLMDGKPRAQIGNIHHGEIA